MAFFMASIERKSQLTDTSSETPPPAGCEWASIKPGTMVILSASILTVFAEARLRISSLEPTARKRSPFIAKASALGIV